MRVRINFSQNRSSYTADQFSTVSPDTAVMSLWALTTVVLPRLRAMAAMSMSIFPIGRPVCLSSAAIRPYSSAAGSVSGQTISSGNTRRTRSAFLSRLLLFSTPYHTPREPAGRCRSDGRPRRPRGLAHRHRGDGGCNRRRCRCRAGTVSFPHPPQFLGVFRKPGLLQLFVRARPPSMRRRLPARATPARPDPCGPTTPQSPPASSASLPRACRAAVGPPRPDAPPRGRRRAARPGRPE